MDDGQGCERLGDMRLAERPGANLDTRSLLALDSCRGHLTETVWQQLHTHETDLAIIPRDWHASAAGCVSDSTFQV